MNIRKAELKDCKACFELSKIRELLCATGEPISESYFEQLIITTTIFLVAQEKNKIIGYSTADVVPGKLAMGWLLAVDPSYQNKGVGKELMVEMEKRCKKRGANCMIGYSPAFNKKTLAFHKKNGFIFGEKMFEMIKKLV